MCASTLLGWLSPKPFDLKIARALFDEGVAKGFSPALYARGAIQEKYGAGAKWHARDAGYLEAARKGNVLAILAEWRITNFQ